MSDNSYRLFVSEPDPNQDAYAESTRRESVVAAPLPADGNGPSTDGAQQGGSDNPQRSASQTPQPLPTIKGPVRLLRLLPRDTRHTIGRMLELDPRKRATIDEIMTDPWVANALVCRQEEEGRYYHAPNHRHVLEGSAAQNAPSEPK